MFKFGDDLIGVEVEVVGALMPVVARAAEYGVGGDVAVVVVAFGAMLLFEYLDDDIGIVGGQVHIVGDDDGRGIGTGFHLIVEVVHQDIGGVGVEVASGFIAEEDAIFSHHSSGEGHPLLLAARGFVGAAEDLAVGCPPASVHLHKLVEGHFVQDVVGGALAFSLGSTLQHLGEGDVLVDVEVAHQVGLLEDEAEIAAADIGEACIAVARGPEPLVVNLGAIGCMEEQTAIGGGEHGVVHQPEGFEDGAFATARLAYDEDDAAAGDGEAVDAEHGASVAVGTLHIVEFKIVHSRSGYLMQ